MRDSFYKKNIDTSRVSASNMLKFTVLTLLDKKTKIDIEKLISDILISHEGREGTVTKFN